MRPPLRLKAAARVAAALLALTTSASAVALGQRDAETSGGASEVGDASTEDGDTSAEVDDAGLEETAATLEVVDTSSEEAETISEETDSTGEAAPTEEAADTIAEVVGKAADKSADDATRELDIRTSTFLELAAWCRELGLSEGGTREELAARIRTYYGLKASGSSAVTEGSTVIVESARGTEYFTLESVGEEYARLRGDVIVNLKDGDTTHRIRARELLYNRTRNILTAGGNVEYVKTGPDATEIFRGDSLTVDMDTWAGVFLDGSSVRSKEENDMAYRFSAGLIARAEEDVTVLTNAVVSNATSEDPHWSLAASKIWLLPGNEWAIANAVLKVGAIPVLYIPFFYLPADELVFHPVIGYRTREGSFVQTTTYVLGRPKPSETTESSIMTIMGGGEDQERRREGLFLRSTGKKTPAKERTSLSLLMDAYTNLGYYIGSNLRIPKQGLLGETEVSLGFGFTRDVYFLTDNYYSPFADGVGESRWNSATLFGGEVPFRYRFKTTGSVGESKGSLSWAFPFYSDPYVDEDFLDRTEKMDWLNAIKQGTTVQEENEELGVLGSYEWRLAGSVNPDMKAFSPYFSSFNVSSAVTALSFKTKESALYKDTVSPSRTFFYPDTLTFLSLSAALSGKPFSTAKKKPDSPVAKTEDLLAGIGVPRSPWDEDRTVAEEEAKDVTAEVALKPPALSQSFSSGTWNDDPVFELSYTLTPSGSSDMKFRSTPWTEATEVTWDEATSILTVGKLAGTVTAKLTSPREALSESLSVTGNATWQGYTYANKEAEDFDTEDEWEAALLRNYKSTYYTTSATNVVTARPFVLDPVWSETNLKHTLTSLLMKSTYDGETTDDKGWKTEFGSWEADSVSAHSLALNLAASVRELPQTLSLTLDLPPTPDELAGNSAIRIWRTTTTASGSAKELYDDIELQPFTFTETVDLAKNRRLKQEVVYTPEEKEVTSTSSSLLVGPFSASFDTSWSVKYELQEGVGWSVVDEEERLRAKSLSMGYNQVVPVGPHWKRRIAASFDINSSLAFDLQKYTQSSFTFSLGTTFKIAEFVDVSFGVKSQNSVVFRYFQDLPWFDAPFEMPGETNILTDLLNSFRFGDEEARRSSGFKLKSFSLDTTHYMGDWNAKFSLDLTPYLDQSSSPFRYRFNPEISFLMQWIPISEIKVETYRDEDGFVYR